MYQLIKLKKSVKGGLHYFTLFRLKMECNGKIKTKKGNKIIYTDCPYNKWRCINYSFRTKKSEPTENCKYIEPDVYT